MTALGSVAVRPSVEAPATQTLTPARSRWWAAGFGALVGVALFVLVHRALPDDAYITLDYARNLAEHGRWGLLPDRMANTQTSPLNAWLLAGGIAVLGRPVMVAGALLAGTFALIAWWADDLRRAIALPPALPYVLVGLLVSSPLLVSSVGLETYLGVAVLLGVARYAVAGRPVVTGVLCGAAVLTRPDLAVPGAILSLLLERPREGRVGPKLGTAALVAAAIALPWHLFSWRFLGGFVPDTTWFKTQFPHGPTMLNAPVTFFWIYYPVLLPLAALPVLAGLGGAVVAFRRRREPWARVTLTVFVAGWTHWTAMVAIGAFPQAWYYAPLVACSIFTVATALVRAHVFSAATVSFVLVGACLVVTPGPLPWTALPMAVNLARSSQYQQIGSELAELTGGQSVFAPGEIGALAFSSAVPVVDQFGDRALARVLLDPRYDRAGSLGKPLMRLNWRYRPNPPAPTFRYRLTFGSVVDPPPGRVVRIWPIDMPARGSDTVVLSQVQP